MFNESGERVGDKPKIIGGALAGGVAVSDHSDEVKKRADMIQWIKDCAGKRGIVLASDAITGKTGVGSPGTKKRPGYGSQGAPGLLQKALSCGDEKVTELDKSTGKYVTRLRWKIVVAWEIRMMAEKIKKTPLKQKNRGDGYVGLLKIGTTRNIVGKAQERIEEYVKSIRCELFYHGDGAISVRLPVQYDRKAIEKKIKGLM